MFVYVVTDGDESSAGLGEPNVCKVAASRETGLFKLILLYMEKSNGDPNLNLDRSKPAVKSRSLNDNPNESGSPAQN